MEVRVLSWAHRTCDAPYGAFALTGLAQRCYRVAQRLRRGRLQFKVALVLRKLALRRRAVVDADPLGFRCRFYPHENLGDRFVLFMPRFFEDEEREFLSAYVRPGQVFVDVGANAGFYSLFAARAMEGRGRVIALEPNPTMHGRLVANLRYNGLDGLVTALPVGVSDRAGEFALHLDPRQLGAATLLPGGGTSIQVRCDTLLAILRGQGIERVDVLKVDIEGYERVPLARFFEDAPRALWPRVLLIETVEGLDLDALGYALVRTTHSHNSIFVLR